MAPQIDGTLLTMSSSSSPLDMQSAASAAVARRGAVLSPALELVVTSAGREASRDGR
jgi:hypothetical protein